MAGIDAPGKRSRYTHVVPNREVSVDLHFRSARATDLERIVQMLVDDSLGKQREDPGPLSDSYHAAFGAIDADPHQELVVVEAEGRVVGVFQLTFIPYLTYQGSWRGQIEGVRVDASVRGQGVGQRMMEWAIQRCRGRGCRLVQLTTDKRRSEAHRFYERLGFVASHEGMKLDLARR